MPKSDHSRWWVAAEVMTGLALLLLPWCLGGAPIWSSWVLLAVASGAALTWSLGGARYHRRYGRHLALAFPILAGAFCVVQLVPLPPAVLGVLSPPSAELREFALVPLGLERWRPLSLDPPSTARAFARVVSLGMLLFVALELGRRPESRRRLFIVQALVGVSIAVTGVGHLLASADTLFGVYAFKATLPFISPFGNANHLAAFLALSGTIALGLALDSPSRDQALGWAIAAFVCGVCVFLSMSRGGIGTFVATWLLVGAALLAKRGGGLRSVLPWVVIGATLLGSGLLAFEQLVARAETVSSVDRLRSTKVDLWPIWWQGTSQAWPLGLGAGAFELAFTRWQAVQPDVTFTHPENLAFQSLADWGLPLTLLFSALGLVVVRRGWLAVQSLALERTALLGVVGVLFHDVFDFSLELHAVGVATTVMSGLVLGAAPPEERHRVTQLGPAFAVGAVSVAALLLAWGLPTHHAVERTVSDAIAERRSLDEVRTRALAAIDRHPADWVLYAVMAADQASRADARQALAWVNRLLFLRPNDAGAHIAAAQALLRLGKPLQALGELKAAWVLGDTSTIELGLRVAILHDALDRLLIEKPGHLRALWARLRAQGRNNEALQLLDAVELSGVGLEVRSEAALLRVEHESELGDPEQALAAWDSLPEGQRNALPLALVRVTLLSRLHRDDEALHALETLVARNPVELDLTLRLVDLLSARGRPAAALETLDRSRPFFSGAQQRSLLYQREATLFMQMSRWGRALEALQTASRIEPRRPDLHYRIAEVYEQMGSPASALDALRKGRTLDSPEGARAQDLRAKRLEALIDGQNP